MPLLLAAGRGTTQSVNAPYALTRILIRPFVEIKKNNLHYGFQPKDNLISVTSNEHLDNTNKNSKSPKSLENSLLCTNICGKGKKSYL